MPQENKIRLQKFMAECGVASRRRAEDLIRVGKVMVSGEVVIRLETGVEGTKDEARVEGRVIKPKTEGERTLPAKTFREYEKSFRIILKEGRKRRIRRMVEAVGNRVIRLKRIRIGNIRLGQVSSGQHEFLSDSEVKRLFKNGHF